MLGELCCHVTYAALVLMFSFRSCGMPRRCRELTFCCTHAVLPSRERAVLCGGGEVRRELLEEACGSLRHVRQRCLRDGSPVPTPAPRACPAQVPSPIADMDAEHETCPSVTFTCHIESQYSFDPLIPRLTSWCRRLFRQRSLVHGGCHQVPLALGVGLPPAEGARLSRRRRRRSQAPLRRDRGWLQGATALQNSERSII